MDRPNFERERKFGNNGEGNDNFRFFGKSVVYSRQCYNDPENPRKIICKEVRNESDPFNSEKRHSVENVYTQEINDPYIDDNVNNTPRPSFYRTIDKLRNIFKNEKDDQVEHQSNERRSNMEFPSEMRNFQRDPIFDGHDIFQHLFNQISRDPFFNIVREENEDDFFNIGFFPSFESSSVRFPVASVREPLNDYENSRKNIKFRDHKIYDV